MPRNPRIEFEGAIYHVMARGNHKNKIVFSDDDRRVFIATLKQVGKKTGWGIWECKIMSVKARPKAEHPAKKAIPLRSIAFLAG